MTDIYLIASSADDATLKGFLCGWIFDSLSRASL